MPPRSLHITPAPYKKSHLSIPPSPFSPKEPITPVNPPRQQPAVDTTGLKAGAQILPPPQDPLKWLWQCHRCHRVYQLGVTRRCLDDGHYFCAGTTVTKRSRKNPRKVIERHVACASEFDYQGWKAWGAWRRDLAEQVQAAESLVGDIQTSHPQPPAPEPAHSGWLPLGGLWRNNQSPAPVATTKDCWNRCDYPSECRWGKQFGVETPVKANVTVPVSPPLPHEESQVVEIKPATSFEDILISLPMNSDEESFSPQNSPEEPAQGRRPSVSEETRPSMDEVVESAKRRKRRSTGALPSPLGSNPPSPSTSESAASSTFRGLGISGLMEGLKDLKKKHASGSL